MLKIEALRRQRADINAKVQTLAKIEADGAELTAEQLTEFNQLSAEFANLSAQITRREAAERMNAAQAKPVQAIAVGGASAAVHVKPELKQYEGAKMARLAMSVAAGGGDLQLAEQFAAKEIGDADVAMAISTAAGSGGAVLRYPGR